MSERSLKIISGSSVSKKTDYDWRDVMKVHEYWAFVIGYPIVDSKKLQYYATKRLLVKLGGVDNLMRLIDGVKLGLDDQFAPRISDFVQLEYKLNQLLMWGRRRAEKGPIII